MQRRSRRLVNGGGRSDGTADEKHPAGHPRRVFQAWGLLPETDERWFLENRIDLSVCCLVLYRGRAFACGERRASRVQKKETGPSGF